MLGGVGTHMRVEAGAWCAAFHCAGMPLEDWLATYDQSRVLMEKGMCLLEAYEEMPPVFGPGADQKCNGRAFISITSVTASGLDHELISEFSSPQDLKDACMASSTIPLVVTSALHREYRGKAVL